MRRTTSEAMGTCRLTHAWYLACPGCRSSEIMCVLLSMQTWVARPHANSQINHAAYLNAGLLQEFYDGDNAFRWLNQTNFVPLIDGNGGGGDSSKPCTGPGRAWVKRPGGRSTATRALGHTLAPSTWLGMAGGSTQKRNSAHPQSNTSRFFSVDIGLGHFIALDSNANIHIPMWRQAQLDWLAADLSSVDRTKTPWVSEGGSVLSAQLSTPKVCCRRPCEHAWL